MLFHRILFVIFFIITNLLLIKSENKVSKPRTPTLARLVTPTLARLVTPNGQVGHSFGRVEIQHKGEWGTICSDNWTNDNARVICRMIGFHSKHAIAVSNGLLGEGHGNVLLNNIKCNGDETNLDKCQHAGWNGNTCDHAQDAGVICTEELYEESRLPFIHGEILDSECSKRGHLTCECNSGFTGNNCELDVDYCAELVTDFQDGPIPAGQLCQPHGYCISTNTGAVCICEYGYSGEFCHTVIKTELYQSVRCALYATADVFKANITVGCPGNQNCIPDHIHCAVNNKCAKPFGWCLPFEEYDEYMTYVRKTMKKHSS